jgi:hypothetical protein
MMGAIESEIEFGWHGGKTRTGLPHGQRFIMIDRSGRVLSGPAIGTACTGYFGEYYFTETELRRVLP